VIVLVTPSSVVVFVNTDSDTPDGLRVTVTTLAEPDTVDPDIDALADPDADRDADQDGDPDVDADVAPDVDPVPVLVALAEADDDEFGAPAFTWPSHG
jgi:hypothetical protein